MKCHGCSSSMLLERQESTGRVITQWHKCPVCNKMHMHSERQQTASLAHDWRDAHEQGPEISTVAHAPRHDIEYA